MFDQATLAQLHQNYLANQPKTAPAKDTKKKQTGKGGTLTSLISEGGALGGGAAGAGIGTAILPGIGTLIGGAIGTGVGAFTGRLAENKVRDNRYGVGDAAKEGVISGLLSAPGKGLKAGYTGAKVLAKGGKLEDALIEAAAKSSAGKGVIGNVANKVRTSAGDRTAEGFGVKVGASNKGQTITPDKQAQLSDFITNRSQAYGGIKAGAPKQQAKQVQAVYNNVVGKLDEELGRIDRSEEHTSELQS